MAVFAFLNNLYGTRTRCTALIFKFERRGVGRAVKRSADVFEIRARLVMAIPDYGMDIAFFDNTIENYMCLEGLCVAKEARGFSADP